MLKALEVCNGKSVTAKVLLAVIRKTLLVNGTEFVEAVGESLVSLFDVNGAAIDCLEDVADNFLLEALSEIDERVDSPRKVRVFSVVSEADAKHTENSA